MNKPLIVTASCAVWMNQYHTPAELLGYVESNKPGRAIDILSFYGPPSLEKFGDDYMRVGDAEVTLHLLPRDKQAAMAVQQLNKKLADLRAAYMERQQEILAQISKLQALTNDVEA